MLSSLYIWAVQPLQPPWRTPPQPVLVLLLKRPLRLCQPGATVPPSKWAAPLGLLQPLLTLKGKAWSLRHNFSWGNVTPNKPIDPNQNGNINIKLLKQDFLGLLHLIWSKHDNHEAFNWYNARIWKIYTRFHKCCQAYSLLWKWSIFQTKRVLGSSF